MLLYQESLIAPQQGPRRPPVAPYHLPPWVTQHLPCSWWSRDWQEHPHPVLPRVAPLPGKNSSQPGCSSFLDPDHLLGLCHDTTLHPRRSTLPLGLSLLPCWANRGCIPKQLGMDSQDAAEARAACRTVSKLQAHHGNSRQPLVALLEGGGRSFGP